MELSSGGKTPCSTGFPLLLSVLGTHVYQCTSCHCCERLRAASANFFEDSFNVFAHFVRGFTSTPAHIAWSVQQFLTPNSMTHHGPPYPFTPSFPEQLLFVSPVEKRPQTETVCWCGRSEIKTSRSTKRHQYWRIQKLFWAVEKHPDRCLAPNGEYFEGDWSLNM